MHFPITVLALGALASIAGAVPVAQPEAEPIRFPGQPVSKRDAEADPTWFSHFRRFPGQPVSKRDAEPIRFPGQPVSKRDAEADPTWFSHFRRFPGQPVSKRDAEAEAEAKPIRFPGQPVSKRDAEPIRFPGQPVSKRDDGDDADDAVEDSALGYYQDEESGDIYELFDDGFGEAFDDEE